MRLTADEVLERAASVVDLGWAQGDGSENFDSTGGHCAITAVDYSALDADLDVHEAAQSALVKAIGGDCVEAIWKWNDTPGRTKEEVSAMLRAVAASLRAAAHDDGTAATESTVGDLSTEDAGQVEEACI